MSPSSQPGFRLRMGRGSPHTHPLTHPARSGKRPTKKLGRFKKFQKDFPELRPETHTRVTGPGHPSGSSELKTSLIPADRNRARRQVHLDTHAPRSSGVVSHRNGGLSLSPIELFVVQSVQLRVGLWIGGCYLDSCLKRLRLC